MAKKSTKPATTKVAGRQKENKGRQSEANKQAKLLTANEIVKALKEKQTPKARKYSFDIDDFNKTMNKYTEDELTKMHKLMVQRINTQVFGQKGENVGLVELQQQMQATAGMQDLKIPALEFYKRNLSSTGNVDRLKPSELLAQAKAEATQHDVDVKDELIAQMETMAHWLKLETSKGRGVIKWADEQANQYLIAAGVNTVDSKGKVRVGLGTGSVLDKAIQQGQAGAGGTALSLDMVEFYRGWHKVATAEQNPIHPYALESVATNDNITIAWGFKEYQDAVGHLVKLGKGLNGQQITNAVDYLVMEVQWAAAMNYSLLALYQSIMSII